ncbi:hypothetical protein B0H12DRAFT_1133359 [Mycena haematopus]|nr:hypothetical protein B0H12DRAFT_1133359 [Mycena haematopus]
MRYLPHPTILFRLLESESTRSGTRGGCGGCCRCNTSNDTQQGRNWMYILRDRNLTAARRTTPHRDPPYARRTATPPARTTPPLDASPATHPPRPPHAPLLDPPHRAPRTALTHPPATRRTAPRRSRRMRPTEPRRSTHRTASRTAPAGKAQQRSVPEPLPAREKTLSTTSMLVGVRPAQISPLARREERLPVLPSSSLLSLERF